MAALLCRLYTSGEHQPALVRKAESLERASRHNAAERRNMHTDQTPLPSGFI